MSNVVVEDELIDSIPFTTMETISLQNQVDAYILNEYNTLYEMLVKKINKLINQIPQSHVDGNSSIIVAKFKEDIAIPYYSYKITIDDLHKYSKKEFFRYMTYIYNGIIINGIVYEKLIYKLQKFITTISNEYFIIIPQILSKPIFLIKI